MTVESTLILVAGGPGAGKTAVGRALARRIASAVLLDKDVIASPWLDPVLALLNDGVVDRDSRVYWETLRPLEYASLMAAAYDNLRAGKSAIVVAPFGPELRDHAWTESVRAQAATLGARLTVVWIEVDRDDARGRMTARNDARDAWKLANWNAFAGDGSGDTVDRDGPFRGRVRNPYASPAPAAGIDWLVLHNDRLSRIDDLAARVLEWSFR